MKTHRICLFLITTIFLLCHPVVAQVRLSLSDVGNQAQLSWSNSPTYYDLEWRTNLTPDFWSTASDDVIWNSNRYYVTTPITSPSRYFRLVSRDRFTNSFTQLFEYDDNIKDGVLIETNSYSFNVLQTNLTNFVISFPGFGVDFPLTRTNDVLRNESGPIEFSDFYMLDVLLLSDGVNKVFTFVGQEKSDPLDVSFNVTCWTEAKGTLLASDLAGTWAVQGYSDPNLQNTSDGFDPDQTTVTITAIGQNQILIAPPNFSAAATISGMEATLDNAPFNTGSAMLHTLKLASNGSWLCLYAVTSELDDPSDVSVTIMLGTKQ